MPRSLFISLPVADVARSSAFYQAIGMVRDDRLSGPHAAAMIWIDTVRIMLLERDFYATLAHKPVADAHAASGALIALGLDSRDAVDAITQAALAAGGREVHGAEDEGTMYSRAFEDPDGHGFGPVWMDPAA
ncbi:VOC family protein [Sphingomonas sp. Leaf4]|uniref:VOC family protein n=1 Tax=Sphingomonas sp. Leaf4 TaxID=2876553 RepID=UPI001E363AC2|nr:VOC family protein [Sphingomonas sp. Leaf4]